MVDEANGAAGTGPPSFPGAGSASPPPMPPPMPPPPPSYPDPPAGGYPPPQVGYGAAPGVPGASPYASWGLRLGGYLIDGIILGVVQFILDAGFRHSNTLVVHMTMTNNGNVRHNTISFVALGIGLVVSILYATILIGAVGKTVGMMAVGVRCVRDETHAAVGYGKAFGRALVERIFFILFPVWVVNMLFPIWDKKRQTLHDKVVSTVVLRTRFPG
jgi:uncharacterized RDD family membrane protein YckC